MGEPCIFCQIAAGTTVAEVVHESAETLFFNDISPKAPVHVVGIPKQHIASLANVRPADAPVLGQLLTEIAQVAQKAGVADGGYRVLTNVGSDAGQEVRHLHVHLLGGEPLGPMRC